MLSAVHNPDGDELGRALSASAHIDALSGTLAKPPLRAELPARTSSLALWPWGELAERIGLGREHAQRLAALSQAELRDPAVMVDQAKANRLATVVSERYGPGAGLAAALTVEAGHFNLVELLARSARTIAHGLDLACQFVPLIHVGGRLEHDRFGDRSVVCWRDAGAEVHAGYVELLFGVAFEGLRRETGRPVEPERVWFTHPAPDDLVLHRKVLGPKVSFGMPHAGFELDAETAALPLLRANAATRARAAEAAREALREQRRRR